MVSLPLNPQTTSPILVTGAAGGSQGATGNLLVGMLLDRGLRVRAFVRQEDERSKQLRSLGAEVVTGDLLDLDSVRQAMQGVRHAYFCYPVKDGLLEAALNFALSAKEAGLESIVNLSQNSAIPGHPSIAARQHWLVERLFDLADIGVIHLKGAVFFENLKRQFAATVASEGKMYLPFERGDGVIPLVAGEDVARVAASILAEPKPHIGKTYVVTSAALNMQEVEAIFQRVLRKPVEYVEISVERYQQDLAAREGAANAQQINHLSVLWKWLDRAQLEKGVGAGQTTDVVQTIGGTAPKSLEEFIAENAPVFGGIAA